MLHQLNNKTLGILRHWVLVVVLESKQWFGCWSIASRTGNAMGYCVLRFGLCLGFCLFIDVKMMRAMTMECRQWLLFTINRNARSKPSRILRVIEMRSLLCVWVGACYKWILLRYCYCRCRCLSRNALATHDVESMHECKYRIYMARFVSISFVRSFALLWTASASYLMKKSWIFRFIFMHWMLTTCTHEEEDSNHRNDDNTEIM